QRNSGPHRYSNRRDCRTAPRLEHQARITHWHARFRLVAQANHLDAAVVTIADVITDNLFLRLVDAVTVIFSGGVALCLLPVTLHLVANHATQYCATGGSRILSATVPELVTHHATDYRAKQFAGYTTRVLLRHFMHL